MAAPNAELARPINDSQTFGELAEILAARRNWRDDIITQLQAGNQTDLLFLHTAIAGSALKQNNPDLYAAVTNLALALMTGKPIEDSQGLFWETYKEPLANLFGEQFNGVLEGLTPLKPGEVLTLSPGLVSLTAPEDKGRSEEVKDLYDRYPRVEYLLEKSDKRKKFDDGMYVPMAAVRQLFVHVGDKKASPGSLYQGVLGLWKDWVKQGGTLRDYRGSVRRVLRHVDDIRAFLLWAAKTIPERRRLRYTIREDLPPELEDVKKN